jgi:hypothetical protein
MADAVPITFDVIYTIQSSQAHQELVAVLIALHVVHSISPRLANHIEIHFGSLQVTV